MIRAVTVGFPAPSRLPCAARGTPAARGGVCFCFLWRGAGPSDPVGGGPLTERLTLSHCCGHRCPLGVSVSECVIIDAACAAARGPHDVYRSLWVDINPFTPRRVPPRLPLHFHTYTFVGDATALMSTHTLHRAQPHTARRAAVDRLRRLAAGHRALPAHTRPRPLVLRALPRRRARRRRPRRAAAAAAVLLMPCAAGSLSE